MSTQLNLKLAVYLLIIFLSGTSSLFSQPDYQERLFQTDTLQSLRFGEIEATEGSIDPDNYILGPGDKFFVSINGIEEIPLTLQINQEGFLYIPRVGGIDLRGHSLSEGKTELREAIDRYYKNVEIFISLIDFRKIKVSLVGDVKKPATFVLSANDRLLDLIKRSNGLNRTADFRNIKVVSKNETVNFYDILTFLRKGNYKQNPYLKEGDVVIVDKVDKFVTISGSVMYPATYEYKQMESASELIDLAGGILSEARTDSIELVRFLDDKKTQVVYYYSLNELLNSEILLENKDQIIVRAKPEYLEEKYVNIRGEIKYPGWYKIDKEKTYLSEIILEAGGLTEDASLNEATLYRAEQDTSADPEFERLKLIPRVDMTDDEYDYYKAKSRQRGGNVVVDFEDLLISGNLEEDILLKRGDRINIPEKKNYIIMLGQVVNPGNIIYDPTYTIEDYIELSGGFAWRALEDEVRVIKVNTGEWVEADDVEKLEPGDTIWIPEDPPGPKFWDVFTTSLQVLGQVATIIAATVAVIVATR